MLRCQSQGGAVDLDFPRAWWHAYCPEPGLFYGYSCLLGAYSPWWDKWMNGGALDVRRLFMHKDAYAGADLSYPEGFQNIPGHGEVPNRDVAREIVEQIVAGGVTTRPSTLGPNGEEQWKLTRATVSSNPGHILQYPKDLDVEILRGLEIADDVLAVDGSGSWAGKRVPMAAFYAGLDRWTSAVVRDLDDQVIRPLVKMNFGEDADYTIGHKPLAEQAMEQQQEDGAQKQDGGGDPADLFGGSPGGGSGDGDQQPPRPQVVGQQAQKPQTMALRTEAAAIVSGVRRVLGVRMGTLLHGGRAEHMADDEFDAEQLAAGIQEELEHTDDIRIAKQIAKDHLAEDPDYYRRDRGGLPVTMSAHGQGERWITIGGRKSEDGEHAGGFPCKINADGEIIAGGPRGLRGKNVREVYKHFQRARNTPQAKERRYQATVKKQAKAWRISEKEYQQFADEVWKEKQDAHQAREAAKSYARKSLGITAADVNRWENQGLDYSSSRLSKYEFDRAAQSVASQFPDLGWGAGYGDDDGGLEGKLWDLLKEGKVDLLSRNSPEFHADVDEYLGYLASQSPGGLDDPPDADDTDFDFGANTQEDQSYRFSNDPGPKEGDRKGDLVFRSSRWHKLETSGRGDAPSPSGRRSKIDPKSAIEQISGIVGDTVRDVSDKLASAQSETYVYDDHREFVQDVMAEGVNGFVAETCNGVTVNGRCFINATKGGQDTLVHEYLHALSSPVVYDELGRVADEGMCEWFTRKVLGDESKSRGINDEALSLAAVLSEIAGEGAIASAYFAGNLKPLRDSIGSDRLASACSLAERNKVSEAEQILRGKINE